MAGRPGTYAILGLAAAAAFALCTTLRPLQVQFIKDQEQQPEQDQMTAAEALELCANAVVLLLWGAAQTFMAVTAVGATRRVTVSAVLGKLLSLSNAWILAAVLTGVVDLAAGRRLGDAFYYHALFIGFVIPQICSALSPTLAPALKFLDSSTCCSARSAATETDFLARLDTNVSM